MNDTVVAEDATLVRTEIRTFLLRFVDKPETLNQFGLITGGLLDSLATVQMIAFLEARFGIEVDDEDLEVENFDNLDAAAGFVERKRTGR